MATLGDPLADLGYTLIYWTEPGDPPPAGGIGTASTFTALPGFFTRAEIIAEYARAQRPQRRRRSTSTRCWRSTSSR